MAVVIITMMGDSCSAAITDDNCGDVAGTPLVRAEIWHSLNTVRFAHFSDHSLHIQGDLALSAESAGAAPSGFQ